MTTMMHNLGHRSGSVRACGHLPTRIVTATFDRCYPAAHRATTATTAASAVAQDSIKRPARHLTVRKT